MIEHNCSGCIFNNKKNNDNNCSLDRLKILPHTVNENNEVVLHRFCNASRPSEWIDSLSVAECNDLISTVMQEIQPRVGFFVLFNNKIEDLKNTLDDIKNQSMLARYVVVINSCVEYNPEIQRMFKERFDHDTTHHHIVQLVEQPEVSEFIIDEAFRHAKNGWVYVCNSGHRIDTNLIEKIHHRINIQMKKLVVVEPIDDNLNGMLFQSALFKFLNGNKAKMFDDKNGTDALFLDKVREIAQRSDPETFITWEDFND